MIVQLKFSTPLVLNAIDNLSSEVYLFLSEKFRGHPSGTFFILRTSVIMVILCFWTVFIKLELLRSDMNIIYPGLIQTYFTVKIIVWTILSAMVKDVFYVHVQLKPSVALMNVDFFIILILVNNFNWWKFLK